MISSGLVNVFTDDIEAALGLPDHVEMTAGGFVLALSTAEAARRVHGLDVEVGRRAMSLVFWVDDVDAAFRAITEAGAPTVTAPHDTGNDNRNAVVHDPDGTLVVLVAKRS